MTPPVLGSIWWKNQNKEDCLSAWLEQDHLPKDTPQVPFYRQKKPDCFPKKENEAGLFTEWIFLLLAGQKLKLRNFGKRKESLQTDEISHVRMNISFTSGSRHRMFCWCAFTHRNMVLRTLVNASRYLAIHVCP